ncbi:integrase core domain-containing protein [Streptomyces parvus]|uniref:integrase core domain-containing protein n=1 Tax=Streptomyces parvus TaxID=66428 RepID=UPI0037F96574
MRYVSAEESSRGEGPPVRWEHLRRRPHKVLGRRAGRRARSGVSNQWIRTAVDDNSRLALQRDARRREEGNRHRLLAAGPRQFHRHRNHRRTRPDRQRRLLQVTRLARRPGSSRGRPQTNPACRRQSNGKAEHLNRTLLDEWAYARPYRSEQERRDAFPAWLYSHDHHRGHAALDGHSPITRVSKPAGQYSQCFEWEGSPARRSTSTSGRPRCISANAPL